MGFNLYRFVMVGAEKYSRSGFSYLCIPAFIFLILLYFSQSSMAHTTVFIPQSDPDGKKMVRIIHCHPFSGSGIMGIRLHEKDTDHLKGLESIKVIHEGKVRDLSDAVTPDYYTVRNDRREIYTLSLDRKNGFLKPGDYAIVVRHSLHWKEKYGLFLQKTAKFYVNIGGLVTDWPNRLLKGDPEIIPLVSPYGVYAGTLFRAEAVNSRGERIPHARITVEYLNYNAADNALDVSSPLMSREDLGSVMFFTDAGGSFSFIPVRAGIWTFTLSLPAKESPESGKKIKYDSSLTVVVKPYP